MIREGTNGIGALPSVSVAVVETDATFVQITKIPANRSIARSAVAGERTNIVEADCPAVAVRKTERTLVQIRTNVADLDVSSRTCHILRRDERKEQQHCTGQLR